jgi:hypothetical protein
MTFEAIMKDRLPHYLTQGEIARLFPVLSTTSKEGRTTSILLACMAKVDELGSVLLESVGQRVGKRSSITTFTEVCFPNQSSQIKERPDGLIVLRVGSREWRALVEAKVGSNELIPEQIERYRVLAKDNAIDCVVTISNQFAARPSSHPIEAIRKRRSKIPVFHWSWMHVLTVTDLLISQQGVRDSDQLDLLNELRRSSEPRKRRSQRLRPDATRMVGPEQACLQRWRYRREIQRGTDSS